MYSNFIYIFLNASKIDNVSEFPDNTLHMMLFNNWIPDVYLTPAVVNNLPLPVYLYRSLILTTYLTFNSPFGHILERVIYCQDFFWKLTKSLKNYKLILTI